MTLDEFDNAKWTGGMKLEYKNEVYEVAAVSFEEKLVGFQEDFATGNENDLSWARCENIKIIEG